MNVAAAILEMEGRIRGRGMTKNNWILEESKEVSEK